MREVRDEIQHAMGRLWRREIFSRFARGASWMGGAFLFAWTAAVFALLRTGWAAPSPARLLQGCLVALAFAVLLAIWRLRVLRFPLFLSSQESAGKLSGLLTWKSLQHRSVLTPLDRLFLERLRGELRALPAESASPWSVPQIPKLLFLVSCMGILFLLLPWGGGEGVGIAPKPSSELVSQSESMPEPDTQTQDLEQNLAPDSMESSKAETKERKRDPIPRPVDPKFVPARESDGPKTWKESLLYELPVPGEEGEFAGQSRNSSKSYAQWKKIAEETIRKERFDPNEARLVTRYFDKIRP